MQSGDYLAERRGYTHFWAVSADADPKGWSSFASDARKLLKHFQRLVHEESIKVVNIGEGRRVEFVPIGADEYGSFLLTQKSQSFAFCRTNFLPFDALVTSMLLSARKHISSAILTSDGTWDLWEPGRLVCQEVLGFKTPDFASASMDFESYWHDDG